MSRRNFRPSCICPESVTSCVDTGAPLRFYSQWMVADPTDVAAELHARGEDALARGDLQTADALAVQAVELFSSADPAHPDVANALILQARVAHARSNFSGEL